MITLNSLAEIIDSQYLRLVSTAHCDSGRQLIVQKGNTLVKALNLIEGNVRVANK